MTWLESTEKQVHYEQVTEIHKTQVSYTENQSLACAV